jgi:hypothetical protein
MKTDVCKYLFGPKENFCGGNIKTYMLSFKITV